MTTLFDYPNLNTDPRFKEQVSLLHDMVDECLEDMDFDDIYHVADETGVVESQPRDGFYPYTNGGFIGAAYAELGTAQGSGRVPDMIRPFLEQAEKDYLESFRQDHDLPEDWTPWDTDDGPLLASFYEHENMWMTEGGTYFYFIRVYLYDKGNPNSPDLGEWPCVRIRAAINTDFEYGREYGDHDLYDVTLPLSEITAEKVKTIGKRIYDAFAHA